jgi:heme exporter protein D
MADQITDYLSMGGHGAFIWPAYFIAVIVLTALLIISIADTRRQELVLKQLRAARRSARTETKPRNAP